MTPTIRSWQQIGTSVHVLVTEPSLVEAAAGAVERVLDDADAAYSRFRADSELCRLNARPGEEVALGELLAEAIEVALRAARLTDGAVDPTVGRALRLVGYDKDFVLIGGRTTALRLHLEPIPGWQAVRLSLRTRSVLLPHGVELDLGSTGKALAADMAAAAALRCMGRGGVLVSLGGDMASAGDLPPGGWRVLAAEDSNVAPDAPGEVIGLHGGAVATSSTTVRRWESGGIALHHIIDPATGLPVEGPWRTVTVVAGTCVDANTAATAAIVRGVDAPGWLAALNVPARLVATDGAILRIGGWPTPDVIADAPAAAALAAAALTQPASTHAALTQPALPQQSRPGAGARIAV